MQDHLANKDIDLSFLYEIADGSDEFIVDSIGMFIDQSPDILQAVGDAIAVHDWASASASAHKIKANLGFFGMLNSQALIQEIETACKTGAPNPGELAAKFNEVKVIIDDNLVALGQIKAEKEANL
jgi:HPt (histidine-containing phosphotransfer) domain-containing protein